MNEWMYEWMDVQMNEWMYKWMIDDTTEKQNIIFLQITNDYIENFFPLIVS